MFRDDRLEYKRGTLQVKMPEIPGARAQDNEKKPRQTTKFDFSGTNYETCTLGHVACLEAIIAEDSETIDEICKQSRELASGVRKPLAPRAEHDKYSALQADPEFLAHALLFKNLKGKKVKNDGSNSTGANLNDVPLDHHDELGDNDSRLDANDGPPDDSELGDNDWRLDANDGPPDDSEPGDNNSQLTANKSDETAI